MELHYLCPKKMENSNTLIKSDVSFMVLPFLGLTNFVIQR